MLWKNLFKKHVRKGGHNSGKKVGARQARAAERTVPYVSSGETAQQRDSQAMFPRLFEHPLKGRQDRESGDKQVKLIAGLGNPGMKYDGTRHNVGFDVIDLCAEKLGIELNKSKFKGVYGEKMINGEKIILLKPLTYMNLSGESVAPLMKFYRVEPNNLVVIYDDLDLGPGAVRLRQKGSAGGHNGMKSIIAHIGTEAFNRIRVGVGRPPKGEPVPDYVLGKPFAEERTAINEAVQKSAEAVVAWTSDTFIKVMNVYNK